MHNQLRADGQMPGVHPTQAGLLEGHLIWICFEGAVGIQQIHPLRTKAQLGPCPVVVGSWTALPKSVPSLSCIPEIQGSKSSDPRCQVRTAEKGISCLGLLEVWLRLWLWLHHSLMLPSAQHCCLLSLRAVDSHTSKTLYMNLCLSVCFLEWDRMNPLPWVVWLHIGSNFIRIFMSWKFKTRNKAGKGNWWWSREFMNIEKGIEIPGFSHFLEK